MNRRRTALAGGDLGRLAAEAREARVEVSQGAGAAGQLLLQRRAVPHTVAKVHREGENGKMDDRRKKERGERLPREIVGVLIY